MDHYSSSLEEDKMARVKADIDDVKNVMVDNIEKVPTSAHTILLTRFAPCAIRWMWKRTRASACSILLSVHVRRKRRLSISAMPVRSER